MDVVYSPGASNIADFLSRHPVGEPVISKWAKRAEEHVNMLVKTSTPVRISTEEIAAETTRDEELQFVKQALQTSDWLPAPEKIGWNFKKFEQELTVSEDGVILRGSRTGFASRRVSNNESSI